MERNELIQANAAIFSVQGKALDSAAHKEVKVLVVGNPANTNCLIAMKNAPSLNPKNFTAMTRLDHNRAMAQLANQTHTQVPSIDNIWIWGNHSSTQVPDIYHATIEGKKALDLVEESWYQSNFIPRIQKRGAEIIEARGLSSAASAANAAIDHMRDWALGSDAILSMAVPSTNNPYKINEQLIYSYPVRCTAGDYSIVDDVENNDFILEKMKITEQELIEELSAVSDLLPK